jgi:hypothetical protein
MAKRFRIGDTVKIIDSTINNEKELLNYEGIIINKQGVLLAIKLFNTKKPRVITTFSSNCVKISPLRVIRKGREIYAEFYSKNGIKYTGIAKHKKDDGDFNYDLGLAIALRRLSTIILEGNGELPENYGPEYNKGWEDGYADAKDEELRF